jgi:hypothetical protein
MLKLRRSCLLSPIREIVMSKDEIEQMAAQMLAEMPNARQQVAIALEHELHERALERAGRESLSATPSKQSFKILIDNSRSSFVRAARKRPAASRT